MRYLSFGMAFMVWAVSVWSAGAVASQQDCALTQAMGERRAEVRQRNSDLAQVGIQERNSSIIDSLPTISQGACLDRIHSVMDSISSSMQTPLGSLLSSSFTRQLTTQINNATCREAERYFRDQMARKVGTIDDRFGIIRSGGQITGYEPGRTVEYDVRSVIQVGQEAAGAASNVPLTPPGRSGATNVAPSNTTSPGVRNALNGL